MNPSPRKRWDGWEGDPTYNPGCGIMAMGNVDRARWQSLLNLRDPPDLVNIPALALAIRRTYKDTAA
jgi:hypothetical protein